MRILVPLLLLAAGVIAQQSGVFRVLSSTVEIGAQGGGVFLVSSNQLLQPWGELTAIKGRPVDVAYDSAKRVLAVLNSRGVQLLDGSTGAQFGEVPSRSTSYTGVTFRPGDRELWASETTRNGPDSLLIASLDENAKLTGSQKMALPGHPVPCGIAFSTDGKTAYVAMSRNNSLAVIDAGARKLTREIETGMAPFGVVACAKNKRIFVSNRGGRRPRAGEVTGPSSGMQVLTDARTGSSASGTITVIDMESFATREINVGLAPSSMTLSPDESTLAVANSHSDSVSLIDTKSLERVDVAIPAYPENTVGSQPVNVAFAPDGNTIYVAAAGSNAITLLRKQGSQWKAQGSLPTGWFPSGLVASRDGSLRVIAIKGTGSTADPKGTFNSRQFEGALIRLPAPLPAQLAAGTREVRAANMPKFEPAGGVSNLPSLGIEHVIFIIKENRTYDQVFADIPKGNRDPSLVMYGRDVTPNHHALAERYVLLDNFYTGGAISFDGHHWLMQAFVSDYVERAFSASPRGYAWNMADALTVSPAGFFWQSATRPLDVRIYGEFCQPAKWNPTTQTIVDIDEAEQDAQPWMHYWKAYKENRWQNEVGCRSGVPAITHLISARYPNSTMSVPDQVRAEEWLREFREREKSGKMPNISILTLNNDHTSGRKPGAPTPRAMVADNDYALGRIVDAVSKSRFWPKTLILVTEDDAQDGIDHVDGHRTIALAIGPNVRRATLDSNHYNHTSMVRTIQDVFRIPPRTRYLASARAMNSVFTPQADTSAYDVIVPKIALDEMNPPAQALRGRERWAAEQSAAMDFSEVDDVPQDMLNRILWWDAKGWNTEYPKLRHQSSISPAQP
ncbi:MAG: bifunctional YncE family protein/alkaline phosphatase family protein [Bryobacterales bacterium]|nr:bifunctional YncE family protein/alkaline phosphatase family protein [Bryobacterales bacterium]